LEDKNQISELQNAPIEVANLLISLETAFRVDSAMRNSALQAVFAAVTSLGFSCGDARATVLTFDITKTPSGGWVGNFAHAPQDYGDRVAGFSTASGLSTYHYGSAEGPIPEIEVGHGPPGTDGDLWNDNNGGLDGIILPYSDGAGIFEVILAADSIYDLDLHGLDVGVWNGPIAPSFSLEW
jgi:hypothetical protein